jgi:hypothetical protein
MTDKTIFRYKFSEPFVADLYNFAKIHQYDDRVGYKEAWGVWVEDNKELVSRECERLMSLEYDGDILDKMFKSARYYFRKKSTEKKAPATRREYVSLQKSVLEKMDRHIEQELQARDRFYRVLRRKRRGLARMHGGLAPAKHDRLRRSAQ